MGYRLSKIYTKTGDQGTTALSDNHRCPKDAIAIHAVGELDELNAHIGTVVAFCQHQDINKHLQHIQHHIFNLGGEISYPEFKAIEAQHITDLEMLIDQYNVDLPPLKEFILPGGSQSASLCHIARTVCRRVERVLVTLQHQQPERNPLFIAYINRLSDLLFVFSRALNYADNQSEILWNSHRTK